MFFTLGPMKTYFVLGAFWWFVNYSAGSMEKLRIEGMVEQKKGVLQRPVLERETTPMPNMKPTGNHTTDFGLKHICHTLRHNIMVYVWTFAKTAREYPGAFQLLDLDCKRSWHP